MTETTSPAFTLSDAAALADQHEESASRLYDLLQAIEAATGNSNVVEAREDRDAIFRLVQFAKADLEALEDMRTLIWRQGKEA